MSDSISPDLSTLHQPVMLAEVLEGLHIAPGKVFLDGTLGFGGHAEAILKAADATVKLIGLDRDANALASAKQRLTSYGERIMYFHTSFQHFDEAIEQTQLGQVDGMLLDLGVSSPQLDKSERGFSFRQAGPLDMRMDQSLSTTAADIVNTYPENELADILYQLGDERLSRRYARAIVEARQQQLITTTEQLENIIWKATPSRSRHGRLHPATRSFQALRIHVNQELTELDNFLSKFLSFLKPGGRIAIISYHSLEDRRVKQCFRQAKQHKQLELISKKPLVPTEEEINSNPRARSAKLRIAIRSTPSEESL